ncbi:MAG TPA: hypothetical protein VKA10_12145 [Prolixibacteraceae bacterium]|nr:hypothetical protein [Prolixibacteraceae bacterium]
MDKHVKVVAALQIGLSVFTLIVGIIVYIVFFLVGDFAEEQEAKFVLSIISNVLIIFFIVLSIPGIIAGIGLFKRKEWARILTLIISVLELFNFPLGTAVGVYSIWALAQPEVAEEFKNN